MSKDKYLYIILCQMEAIMFLFLQLVFTTHQVMLKLGISLGYSPVSTGTADTSRQIACKQKHLMACN